MTVKDILVTSDDGFDSFGVRVLVHNLRKKYDVKVAGTRDQQSGVGAKISVNSTQTWGNGEVEGVKAIWVSGTPVDAVELAQGYFNKQFDLVISGINMGQNVGPSLYCSGTYNAALFSVCNGLAKHAMAVSWMVDPKHWFRSHDGSSHIKDKVLQTPGRNRF